ncbi:hypothetical protein [Actinacidiphila sp. bgisy160]|uniref:hypothetical protein n=1 Tax=Actinacidiphila sp. bgisy160 TaxID=3413796 RepID=UPI003D763FF2
MLTEAADETVRDRRGQPWLIVGTEWIRLGLDEAPFPLPRLHRCHTRHRLMNAIESASAERTVHIFG